MHRFRDGTLLHRLFYLRPTTNAQPTSDPKPKGAHIVYEIKALAANSPITLTVNAVPGATLQAIHTNFENNETADNHHDAIIFQGGKNNALSAGTGTTALVSSYQSLILSVQSRANTLGIPVLFRRSIRFRLKF